MKSRIKYFYATIFSNNSLDITIRAIEAIAYRRKLITDCPLDLTEYFNKGQVQKFNNVKEISMDFILDDLDPNDFNAVYDYNPMKRLYFIQEKLDKE